MVLTHFKLITNKAKESGGKKATIFFAVLLCVLPLIQLSCSANEL